MANVIYACIIMHNMIIEDEVDEDLLVLHVPSSSQTRLRRASLFTTCKLAYPTCRIQKLITLCAMTWYNICGMKKVLIINRFP